MLKNKNRHNKQKSNWYKKEIQKRLSLNTYFSSTIIIILSSLSIYLIARVLGFIHDPRRSWLIGLYQIQIIILVTPTVICSLPVILVNWHELKKYKVTNLPARILLIAASVFSLILLVLCLVFLFAFMSLS